VRGNLADLAATGLASEPTLRKWIAAEPDQPWIIKRGSNGDAYEIDLAGAVEAWQRQEAAKTAAARERAAQLQQLGLDLGVGSTARPDEDGGFAFSIAERRQLLEEEFVAMKLAEKRGELVRFADVAHEFGEVLVLVRQQRESFAARLAKRVDMSREQLAAVEKLMTADHKALAQTLERWGLGGDASSLAAAAVDNPAA
jgi:hypothetical protein